MSKVKESSKDILIRRCSDILNIPNNLVNEMIERNALAKNFIKDEELLNLSCEEENLNFLLGTLLFRDDYDRNELTEDEIKILKDSYNITYKKEKMYSVAFVRN